MDEPSAPPKGPATDPSGPALSAFAQALGLPNGACARVHFTGNGALPSRYPVTAFAAAAIGSAALALSELIASSAPAPRVLVDRRLASLWFGMSLRPEGWEIPAPWDPIAGDYASTDGWIRLHTNAPHHRGAALAVLGCAGDRAAVAKAVSGWSAAALEGAVVEAKGCAAAMRTAEDWAAHPQGQAVAGEPLIAMDWAPSASADHAWQPTPLRPLAGLRVLDLTRVLAGPVATRFLAGYGAQVLRIDPPGWNEPGVVPELTPGKRCARLDLHLPAHRAVFEQLLAGADILVHGYRADALERLGYGAAVRCAIRPGLIDVALDAYGWTGPWCERRGFDSLVQMSCGIAEAGMQWKGTNQPHPLPVQALDHATGYLVAAAALRGLIARRRGEASLCARLSLARVAHALCSLPGELCQGGWTPAGDGDFAAKIEHTGWGPARRLTAPVVVEGTALRWMRGAVDLGTDPPAWPPQGA